MVNIDNININNKIDTLDKAKVIVIGDLMLDIYYEGDVSRISPEAPVPVVEISKKRFLLGGAGNVAKNIKSFNASCILISSIGKDQYGMDVKNLLNEAKIEHHLIESNKKCTTVKTRIFARNQQMIRYDEENREEIQKKEKKELLKAIEHNLQKENNVIILSDYGKGFLYKNIIEDIYTLAKTKNYEKPKIIIDPKPINKAFYKNAYLMTPNTKEASELSQIKCNNKDNIIKMGKKIQKELKTENMLITLGAQGMALFYENSIYHIKSTAKQVFDVTGAGDTVIAIMSLGIANTFNLIDTCLLATLGAGIVVEKVGSVCTNKEEIKQALTHTKIELDKW